MAFMLRIRGHESVLFQIVQAFRHEFLMGRIWAYAGAKRFGKVKAFGVGHIPAEKRPCPADIRLDGMNGTTLPGAEKNAVPVLAGLHLPFSISENAIRVEECLFFEIEAFIKALQILGAQDNAAFPFATLTAHLTVKDSFLHDINSLRGVYVQP